MQVARYNVYRGVKVEYRLLNPWQSDQDVRNWRPLVWNEPDDLDDQHAHWDKITIDARPGSDSAARIRAKLGILEHRLLDRNHAMGRGTILTN